LAGTYVTLGHLQKLVEDEGIPLRNMHMKKAQRGTDFLQASSLLLTPGSLNSVRLKTAAAPPNWPRLHF
jgi:hypothetical protein